MIPSYTRHAKSLLKNVSQCFFLFVCVGVTSASAHQSFICIFSQSCSQQHQPLLCPCFLTFFFLPVLHYHVRIISILVLVISIFNAKIQVNHF